MKKQGYLLLVLLMSAFVFCSCGQKDTKEAQDQTEETAKPFQQGFGIHTVTYRQKRTDRFGEPLRSVSGRAPVPAHTIADTHRHI